MKKGYTFILSNDYARMIELAMSGQILFGITQSLHGNRIGCTIKSDKQGLDIIGGPNVYFFFDQFPGAIRYFNEWGLLFFDHQTTTNP